MMSTFAATWARQEEGCHMLCARRSQQNGKQVRDHTHISTRMLLQGSTTGYLLRKHLRHRQQHLLPSLAYCFATCYFATNLMQLATFAKKFVWPSPVSCKNPESQAKLKIARIFTLATLHVPSIGTFRSVELPTRKTLKVGRLVET